MNNKIKLKFVLVSLAGLLLWSCQGFFVPKTQAAVVLQRNTNQKVLAANPVIVVSPQANHQDLVVANLTASCLILPSNPVQNLVQDVAIINLNQPADCLAIKIMSPVQTANLKVLQIETTVQVVAYKQLVQWYAYNLIPVPFAQSIPLAFGLSFALLLYRAVVKKKVVYELALRKTIMASGPYYASLYSMRC